MPKQIDLEETLEKSHKPWTPTPEEPLHDFRGRNGLPASATNTSTPGPSMTRQEFAADCDINVLMDRYQNEDIGAIMRRSTEPVYVDFYDMPSDLMGTLQLVQDAENAFMTLPAQVRREFDNDPIRFVDFASDPGNLDQMRNWGLAPPAPVPPPAPTPAAAAPSATPTAPSGAAAQSSP